MSSEQLKQPNATINNQWESLSDIEFAGDNVAQKTEETKKIPEEEAVQKCIEEIKAILDTSAVAKSRDLDGLTDARKKDQDILALCESKRKELADGIAEYRALCNEMAENKKDGKYAKLYDAAIAREQSFIHKVLTFFHRPDKKLDSVKTAMTELDEKAAKLRVMSVSYSDDEINAEERMISNLEKTATNEEKFLANFEEPLDREEKDRLLNYDVLAKLSTDEYFKLWKHLNPQYVSHVTRQGYRDHAGVYHNANTGMMWNGFKDILKSGKTLHSLISTETGVSRTDLLKDKDTFYSFMEETYFKNGIPKSLLESEDLSPITIARIMGNTPTASPLTKQITNPDHFWRDRTSIHVGGNNVIDHYYGAESGNEVFFIFPADVVASQSGTSSAALKHTQGHRVPNGTLVPYTSESLNNDIDVHAQNGLPIDAGLVFLPKSILVDPKTGSKYSSFDAKTMTGITMTTETGGIPAEDYWESYFKEHPEEKPAHIIYYDGEPETAVAMTLAENGIYLGNHGDTSKKTGDSLGFDDKISNTEGSELNRRLKEEAQKFFALVADYIRSKKDASI